jgi:peptide/nickel transport system permease protein
MRYFLGRVGQAILLLAGVSLLSFAFLQLAPGNFFSEMRLNPQISDQTVDNLRKQFGVDEPLFVRYGRWLRCALKGDLGFSFAYNSPVTPLLLARAHNTLLLTAIALVLAWCIAVPMGVLSASSTDGALARTCSLASAVLLSTPELLLALLGLMITLRVGWMRRAGFGSPDSESSSGWQSMATAARHLILPAIVLALANLPVVFQHTYSAVKEVVETPYISAARAHGIGMSRILFHHALRPALNPLTSLLGTSLASLLSASLLVEVVVGWPGIGPLLLEAILNRDIYIVIGGVMLSAVLLICGTLVADVLLFAVDPRIRVERLS